VEALACAYGRGPSRTVAVQGVSIQVGSGQVTALVGESGSGKSTVARAVAGVVAPTAGRLFFDGQPLAATAAARLPSQRRAIQIIFQNPDSSLNPRHTVHQLVARPIALFGDRAAGSVDEQVRDALLEVQLDPELSRRYPHELSGGQKQRVAIARALVARPQLVICDEIVSGQDVSVQAALLDLMRRLQSHHHMALLFISHDLAVVRSLAEYVYVVRGGRVVEEGPTFQVFESPADPYTASLLAAVQESVGAL
jgi:ABC-type glutathione transport system ATPase component